jgi:hypothetical protein
MEENLQKLDRLKRSSFQLEMLWSDVRPLCYT